MKPVFSKKHYYLIIILGIIICVPFLISAFVKSEYYIKKQINRANYCETKNDCYLVGHQCPFGCFIYVNRGQGDQIKSLVESYHPFGRECVYGCISCQDVKCDDRKCVPVCD